MTQEEFNDVVADSFRRQAVAAEEMTAHHATMAVSSQRGAEATERIADVVMAIAEKLKEKLM